VVADRLPGRDRTVVLLRHGRTAWNAEGRAQGQADIGLDGTGRSQAEVTARVLAAMEPALLVTSDLARARETAAFLEKETGLTAVEDPRWREYDLGERTGLTLAEFGARIGRPHDGSWDVHADVDVRGAESSEQLAHRVLPAFQDLLERLGEGETGIVVTHGASLRVVVAGALGWPLETAVGMKAMENCGWAVLTQNGAGRLRLSAYNRTALDAPIAAPVGPPPD
jgi:broad specificity phosphatase PhoE